MRENVFSFRSSLKENTFLEKRFTTENNKKNW